MGLGIALAFLSGTAQAQRDEPVKLGVLLALTGGSGQLGQMMLQGSALAADEINEAGGIRGRPLELVPEDSRGLARQGLDGLRKLIDVDRVQVAITGWTPVVVAVAPVAERREVYLISASTATPAVRGLSPYFQSAWMYDDASVKALLPYAKEHLDVQRLGLFTIQNDLGLALAPPIKQAWDSMGGELVAEESHQAAETNFRPSLMRMLHRNPDAIFVTSSVGHQAAQIIRQARELGYQGLFLSNGYIEAPEVMGLGSRADGTYYNSADYDPSGDRELTATFARNFRDRHDRLPNIHEANHYDLVYMYKKAAEALIDEGKPVTGASVREYFVNNMPTYEGAAGDYAFNFEDGSVVRSMVVKTFKDGEAVIVKALEATDL
ncbi:MAG: ABC transporter substrate-binding protein [Aquisalimonadaceae bacterium]